MKNPLNFRPNVETETFAQYYSRCEWNKKFLRLLAAGVFCVIIWGLAIVKGCNLQYADEQRFAVLDTKAQQILNEIAEGKDQSQALANDSLQLALSILDSLQAQKEVDLGNVYFTASDTLGHLSR